LTERIVHYKDASKQLVDCVLIYTRNPKAATFHKKYAFIEKIMIGDAVEELQSALPL
jgi:hypothetical protein